VGKIISTKKSHEYKIEKFVFKKFNSKRDEKKVDLTSIFAPKSETKVPNESGEELQNDKTKELLEKIDELSSQVVEYQMKLEEQKKEFERELIKAKDEGYKEGVKDIKKENENEIEELKLQYLSSITKLQELDLAISEKLSTIEEELIETSIIISKKVIKKEVEEDSASVAKSIASYLLSSLKDELDIKVLVNPLDYESLLDGKLKEGIEIVSDSSVERGGVVILSPKKNIDGTIATRFKKTLQLIKES